MYVKGGKTTEIEGISYDIDKLKKTQTYVYQENVSSIEQAIKDGGPNAVPPIKVRVHNGTAYVVDGHHRLEAFKNLGYDRVPIKYLHKTQLGKTSVGGDYYRSIGELLDGEKLCD